MNQHNLYSVLHYLLSLMSDLVKAVFGFSFFIAYFMGIVIAQGVWAKIAAIFFFPYAWYLVIQKYIPGLT